METLIATWIVVWLGIAGVAAWSDGKTDGMLTVGAILFGWLWPLVLAMFVIMAPFMVIRSVSRARPASLQEREG